MRPKVQLGRLQLWVVGGAIAGFLSACSSVPPPRFHTLMLAPTGAAASSSVLAAGSLSWEVLPVKVPAQVDQPQWVVRTVDGSLTVLEQERWIAPLGDEIRAAVAERVTKALGAAATSAAAGKRWQVRIEVQRFDSVPGVEARLGATWTLTSDAEGAVTLRCRGEFVQAVAGPGYLALGAAHQGTVGQLADAIVRELTALGAGRTALCGG